MDMSFQKVWLLEGTRGRGGGGINLLNAKSRRFAGADYGRGGGGRREEEGGGLSSVSRHLPHKMLHTVSPTLDAGTH